MAEHLDGDFEKGNNEGRGPGKPKTYKLNVQNKTINWPEPTITAGAAIREAGFDADKPWIIILKVAGQPKRELTLESVIELTNPGVEKLRLTPKDVGNGEASSPRRDFELLDEDHIFLDQLALRWATILDNGVRWLLIYGYPLPEGYSSETVDLALLIPTEYPDAQLDMFYLHPAVALTCGRQLDCCNATMTIEGLDYQRWSRHRQSSAWDPLKDNVTTHLGLVDGCLAREVEQ